MNSIEHKFRRNFFPLLRGADRDHVDHFHFQLDFLLELNDRLWKIYGAIFLRILRYYGWPRRWFWRLFLAFLPEDLMVYYEECSFCFTKILDSALESPRRVGCRYWYGFCLCRKSFVMRNVSDRITLFVAGTYGDYRVIAVAFPIELLREIKRVLWGILK